MYMYCIYIYLEQHEHDQGDKDDQEDGARLKTEADEGEDGQHDEGGAENHHTDERTGANEGGDLERARNGENNWLCHVQPPKKQNKKETYLPRIIIPMSEPEPTKAETCGEHRSKHPLVF